jgi:hypothetical protein
LLLSVFEIAEDMLNIIDNAIFLAQFDDNLASEISEAVLPLGLPKSSLPAMIQALASHNTTALAVIPGVTDAIIEAGFGGLKEAYIFGFRYVWVAAGCITAVAATGECLTISSLPPLLSISATNTRFFSGLLHR